MSNPTLVHSMVLAHLVVLGSACSKQEPPATPTAPAIAPPQGSVGGARLGEPCRSDEECGKNLYCELNFNGAEFLDEPGSCVDSPPIYEGRPLVAFGAVHLAEAEHDRRWHREPLDLREAVSMPASERAAWAARLTSAALEEHASVAAFARTLCELLALGAPLWLVEATQRALADELRHAEDAFAWAEAFADRPTRPGRLPAATSPFEREEESRVALLREIFRGGCVGETLAAERALRDSEKTQIAELRAHFARIAGDEARHAALALRTVEWLAAEHEVCRQALAEEVARFEATAPDVVRAIVAPLLAFESRSPRVPEPRTIVA